MKRIVLFISIIVLLISFSLCCFLGYKHYSDNSLNLEQKKVKKLINKDNNLKKEIEVRKEELDKVKESNKERNAVLEVWKKESQKIKNS